MHAFQLLFRASPAPLLLVLCLQLGISIAEEDTTSRRAIILNLEMPRTARASEEVTAKLSVQTELRECMVIKTYLIGSKPVDGAFNYKYTACLCEDAPRTFYWDFQSSSEYMHCLKKGPSVREGKAETELSYEKAEDTIQVAAVVDVLGELNICPEDLAVVPIRANRVYAVDTLYIH
ncbi:prolactin-inducible protein [Erethizon dorsatum]